MIFVHNPTVMLRNTIPSCGTCAEILSDMDVEIAALEAKLSTAREIKAGMMSVLLTPPKSAGQVGKVRMV